MAIARSITIQDTPTAKQFSEAVRAEAIALSDHIANQMIQVYPRIVARLDSEGLYNSPRWQVYGSSPSKAAAAIILPGQKAAEHLEAAAKYAQAFGRTWEELYATPLRVAEEMRRRNGAQMMGR